MSKAADTSGQHWRAHESACIRNGKYAGLIGTVTETRPETGMVRVQIQGVKDGESIDVQPWMKAGALERPQA